VGSKPVNTGSVFLTVIEKEYLDIAERLSLSTTESVVVPIREKLVSGGEIVAMNEGRAGAVVRAMVTQVAMGVNENVTVEGLSSITQGNVYVLVWPKETVWVVRALEKVGEVLVVVCNILLYLR
jgi:hypothetical protein